MTTMTTGRNWLARLLPWWDQATVTAREERSERTRRRAVTVRIAAERQLPVIEAGLREQYRAASERMGGRR